jgi:hypothetical protein
VVIPAFTFIFLDGQTRTYRKASTDPVELMVAPGAPGSTVEVAPTTTPATVTPIDTDIRYLKTAPEASSASRALTEIAEWGPWNAAAVLPLIGGVLLVGFRRAVELDPIGRRARNAQPRAQKIFAEAAALPETEALRAATIIGEALAGFVADKLGLSAAGLTMKSASDGLRLLPHPPSAATLEKFIAAWEEADLRRFAPGAVAVGDVRRFAQEVAAVVETLDKETRG